MKLKVISKDLSRQNTYVVNAETGEAIDGIGSVVINIDASTNKPTVVLSMVSCELDITIPDEYTENVVR